MSVSENPAQTAAFRAALRQRCIAARMGLTPAQHARHSARITAGLQALLGTLHGGTLAFCWPIRAEYDARSLVRDLIARGWRACVPVVVAEQAPMIFRAWSLDAAMTTDPRGIPIPAVGEEVRPDVVLLPLVAFDADGYRLGYGGGYFDRTLALLQPRPWCIGVGFELARVDSIHPAPHDIPLDLVVTEAGTTQTRPR